ncbi:hypothetical protein K470DRAFT_218084 [Piedraia hortae CBS 480.64]|uniref:tRNA-splicing endonuclease subunit Sen2 n=1 Tax=Piedraia hortae CBS 480.64 TaxID=1314780 RepID=A0A6A7BXF4_9PEZI|nr:hypothetical protein K470DRAFT_218084 [Piedraia hortae CBS 480.64]
MSTSNDQLNPTIENPPRPKPTRPKRPNYNQVHSKPLPVEVFPLPDFYPSQPLSILKLCYTWISHFISPPPQPPPHCIGYFSPETRSVHVTEPNQVRKLWEMGFFGKGSLSRSEPSWLDREKARLKAQRDGTRTAEEVTEARRQERRKFKLERARLERLKIEAQRAVERGEKFESDILTKEGEEPTESKSEQTVAAPAPEQPTNNSPNTPGSPDPEIVNHEHLTLTLEEAFFLSYALGALTIKVANLAHPTPWDLLTIFTTNSTFPPSPSPTFQPDAPFLLNYVTYHHFRSLGWVVRPGVKFAVDYLLYNRGPVFSHAEFACIIIPSYTHPYWKSEQGQKERSVGKNKDWWWLHAVNRGRVGGLLRGYRVREFVVRRWVLNRNR